MNQKSLYELMGATAVALLHGGCTFDATLGSEGGEAPVDTVGQEIRRPIGDGDDDIPVSNDPPPRPPREAIEVPYADLKPTGTMKFWNALPSVQIEVENIGTAPAVGHGNVRIAGTNVDGYLYAYGAPITEHTLQPGAKGYIQVRYGSLENCLQYRVVIDTLHQMQPGASLFLNDSAVVKTPCPLTWTTPINSATLFGVYPNTVIGDDTCSGGMICETPITESMSDGVAIAVAEEIRGKTLEEIVGSFTSGRTDGYLCSSCHFDGTFDGISRYESIRYVPPAARNAAELIDKDQWIIDAGQDPEAPDTDCASCGVITNQPARRWSGSDGWANAFITVLNPYEPPGEQTLYKAPYLRQVFEKWIADGYQ